MRLVTGWTTNNNNVVQSNVGTGRVATAGHRRQAQSFNRICQVAPMCTSGPTQFTIPNGNSIGSAVFAGLMPYSPYALYWLHHFPQFFHSRGRNLDSHLIHRFGPTPTHSSIDSAVFLEFTVVSNGQTDRTNTRDSTGKNRPLACAVCATWPKNSTIYNRRI